MVVWCRLKETINWRVPCHKQEEREKKKIPFNFLFLFLPLSISYRLPVAEKRGEGKSPSNDFFYFSGQN